MNTTEKKEHPLTPCGCGRSPTGFCCGWHNLTEEEFRERLAKYDAGLLDNPREIK